ncbi:MAG TPA: hypothetical protein VHW65_07270 [Gemmatimonadales bacterium]|nr:hypothetical protein [Gemmatimonadales bacterium]
MRIASFVRLIVVAGVLAQTACHSDDGSGSYIITRNAGDMQTAAAGTPVQIAPSVLVVDASHHPVANVAVMFAAASAGGLVADAHQVTDASGIATVGNWILGDTTGAYMLSASVESEPASTVTFVANATALPTAAHLSGIVTGGATACGINIASAAFCWGTEAGIDGREFIASLVEPGVTFRSVAAGGGSACALSTAGVAYCWGSNNGGQVGDGSMVDRVAPERVSGGLTFMALGAGGTENCGLTGAGAAYCWGTVPGGAVATSNVAPTAVSGGMIFTAITVSETHACALTVAGAAWCWGLNASGALGDGTTTSSVAPVAVAGGMTLKSVAAGSGYTCGLTTAGAAYCWGNNAHGELGDGSTTTRSAPTAVPGGLTFLNISAGANAERTCGVTTLGAAYCWGQNVNGEIGDGTTADRSLPTAVTGGLTFLSVSTGSGRSCGTSTAGVAYCWGLSPLGDGTANASLVPVVVQAQ